MESIIPHRLTSPRSLYDSFRVDRLEFSLNETEHTQQSGTKDRRRITRLSIWA